MAEGGGDQIKGSGGDTWKPSWQSGPINNPSRNTDLSKNVDWNKAVDEVWTTNKVCIQKGGIDSTVYLDRADNIHFTQFLFKHKRQDLLDAYGWKYSECDGKHKILTSTDDTLEKSVKCVREWVSKQQGDLKEKKLQLSSSNTKDSLQRSLSSLCPAIEKQNGKADVFYDKANNCLYIVGSIQDVDEILQKVKADMRNNESQQVEVTIESESHGLMLRSLNFLEQLEKDYPDVEVHLHDCNTKVTYVGKPEEIEKCKKKIANFFSTLHTETLHMTELQTELLLKHETVRYINDLLRTDNISGVLNVPKQGEKPLLICQRHDSEKVLCKIRENIKEEVISMKDFPRMKEMSSKKVGLSSTESERVIMNKTYEEVHVAATTDVMQRIKQWMHWQDPDRSEPNQQHSVHVQSNSLSGSLKITVVNLKVSEEDMCLWNAFGMNDKFKQCTAGNGEIVIAASEGDADKVGEEIQRYLSGIKSKSKVCCLPEKCAVLLKHQETRDFITKELQKKNPKCVWMIRPDNFNIDVYAETKNEAVEARKSVLAMISVISLKEEFSLVENVLQEEACKSVLQKYQGKAEIFYVTRDEVHLVATADAVEEIITMMRKCDEHISTETSVCVEMPEGVCEYLENQSTFAKRLIEKYGVDIEPSGNKMKLQLTGPKKNLSIVKSTLEKKVVEIGHESLRMKYPPEVLEDENKKKKFELVNSCYLSKKKERVIVNPCPSHTWVMKNSPYFMLVSENITQTNVHAVVCPVDANLKPIGAGRIIMEYGGKHLKEDLRQNGISSSSSSSKPDFQTHFSGEIGNLHCSNIIYAEFPAQNARASGMSTSESVVASKIKKILDVAESKEVFSLAIPLELSDVTSLPICMKAVAGSLRKYVGTFKHLREVYLYCPDGELDHARKIFTTHSPLPEGFNVNFSLLQKDCEGRRTKSTLQLEILKESLIDQKVEVLVNTTNPELDLDCGFVSKTILKIAGKRIQKECDDWYGSGINIGDIAVTSAGRFSDVKHIFHVVLPHWSPTGNFSLMVLELLITKCLIQADRMKMHSIAFPVLGTGKLMYPQHLVAKTMCDTVNKYGRNRQTNIKTVKFAIFEKDVLKIFKIYEEFKSFGRCEDFEDNHPCNILEARIPTPVTSIQMQVLPFHECFWKVYALVEFVTLTHAKDEQGCCFEELRQSGFTKEWSMMDSQLYLLIRILCGTNDSIKKGIASALKVTLEERITSMGFVVVPLSDPVSKKELTSKDQIKMIKKAVLEVKEENKYLQEIKILVKTPKDFSYLLKHKVSKRNSENCKTWIQKAKKKCENFTKTTKCPWKIVRYMKRSDSGFTVTVVADKRDITNVVEKFRSETTNLSDTSFLCENETLTGDGPVQGATGGYHGNQTITGDGLVQGATGGRHGNQTNTEGGCVQDVTGGQHANHGNNGHNGDMNKTGVDTQSIQQEKKQIFPSQENDVFETIEAFVNQGIVQDTHWKSTVKRFGDVKMDGHIVCKDLCSLQKIDDELKSEEFSENNFIVDDTKDHYSSSHEDYEYVPNINIEMTEETFLAIQFFCIRDSSLRQQALHYRDGMLQISCNERENKKAIQTCIESKLKHIEIMNKDDVSFTPAEEPKIKQTIRQIHDSVEGVYCYQLEKDQHSMVHLMAQSYSQLQTAKHKMALGLGRIKQTETRRNRRFENTPLHQNQGEITPTDRHKFSQSFTVSSQSWKSEHTTSYGSVRPVDFTTPEGLLVRVYPGSILHLDVDCIVNAANENLQHGGGVAYVISNAAGYKFDQESRDYVSSHGPLRVGEVCTTTAGDLKYKGVIHSVGPRWHDYSHDQKRMCLDDLKTAVKNSLEEADFQTYKSIAIPAISSGIFGVPKELCTQQYYRAVEEYSRTRGRHSTLTEVHFIDKDTQMCELIQTTFTKCFTGNAGSSYYGAGPGGRGGNFSSSVMSLRKTTPVLQRSRSVSSDGDGSSVDPPNVNQPLNVEHSSSRGKRFEYQISNNLTVHIVHGNIVEIEADAIVSPENVQCDSTGSIAREIARVAGQGYRDNDQSELKLAQRKLKLTEVLDTLGGNSHFKYVLHVVAPKWDVTAIEDQHKYWIDLEQSYNNIFSRIDKEHLPITSLVLPILGTGKMEQPVPVISISKMLAKICKSYAEKANERKTLYFCSNDIVAAKTLRDIFEEEFNKGNDGTETDTDKTGHGGGAGLEVTEDCCICMDTMTKPKKLSCGHMFCTDCIDQQFKYKPACPQCGAVHGKITGDQPPGTMTMKTTKTYWGGGSSLPGYEGCGIINITYSFPPGKQGPDHPTPGRHYQGITRPGFLPDNDKGRLVAKLLKIAFDRKLVFTIGRSRTTGHDGVVTWNDIHHKTRMDGGPQAFGYPDPTYLDRVLDELKAKGVTEESLNDP